VLVSVEDFTDNERDKERGNHEPNTLQNDRNQQIEKECPIKIKCVKDCPKKCPKHCDHPEKNKKICTGRSVSSPAMMDKTDTACN
jgi:hypothetical protein